MICVCVSVSVLFVYVYVWMPLCVYACVRMHACVCM